MGLLQPHFVLPGWKESAVRKRPERYEPQGKDFNLTDVNNIIIMLLEEQFTDNSIQINMECRVKRRNMKKAISLFLITAIVILAMIGAFPAFAEQSAEEIPPTPEPTPTPEITEDGHFDSELLEQWVNAYLKADGWDEPQCSMSIGLWYSGTDETWFYNPDEWMYGVNWSKLPISMVFAEKIANGELSNDSVVTGISLEYALQTVLENSSGPSFYSMVTYLGGNTTSNCAELVPQYANLPDSYYTEYFYQGSYYTARIMTEVTKTLFLGGDERFPNVLEYMKQSQSWDMFKRDDLIRSLNASQTHAAYWGDGAGDYIHCTGVVYTPTPIVLTIMMKNISDLDIMGGVAHHLAALAMQMDEKQSQISLTQEAAVPDPSDAGNEISPGSPAAPASDSEGENAEISDISTSTLPADNSFNTGDTEKIDARGQELASEENASQTRRIWVLGISTLVKYMQSLKAEARMATT